MKYMTDDNKNPVSWQGLRNSAKELFLDRTAPFRWKDILITTITNGNIPRLLSKKDMNEVIRKIEYYGKLESSKAEGLVGKMLFEHFVPAIKKDIEGKSFITNTAFTKHLETSFSSTIDAYHDSIYEEIQDNVQKKLAKILARVDEVAERAYTQYKGDSIKGLQAFIQKDVDNEMKLVERPEYTAEKEIMEPLIAEVHKVVSEVLDKTLGVVLVQKMEAGRQL